LLSLSKRLHRNPDRAGIFINLSLAISDIIMGTSMLGIGIAYLTNSTSVNCTIKAALITFPAISSLGIEPTNYF